MFGSKYAAKYVALQLSPEDLPLGQSVGRHGELDFEDDILAAMMRGFVAGYQAAGFSEVAGSKSAPDFAGAVYRRYSGAGGSTILVRLLGTPSGYAGVASCSVEVGYRKDDKGASAAAGAITASVEKELQSLNTLGSIRKSDMTKAMQSEIKAALG